MAADIELPGEKSRWHYRQVVGWVAPMLLRMNGGWRVTGREHVPDHGGALICPNHVSYLDPPLIGIAVRKRRCCYMAKASLFKIPVVGGFIRLSYSYPVDRDEGGRQALRIANTLLGAGEPVVIFPEGTRSPDGELIQGQLGPAYIAAKARVPIIPTAVWGTDVVLPLNSLRLHRCPVHVKFGEPIHLPEPLDGRRHSRAQLHEVTDDLMPRIAALRDQIMKEVPDKWLARAAAIKARRRAIDARKRESEGDRNA